MKKAFETSEEREKVRGYINENIMDRQKIHTSDFVRNTLINRNGEYAERPFDYEIADVVCLSSGQLEATLTLKHCNIPTPFDVTVIILDGDMN